MRAFMTGVGITALGLLIYRLAFGQAVIPYSRIGLSKEQMQACSEMFYKAPVIPEKRDLCTELGKLVDEFCE